MKTNKALTDLLNAERKHLEWMESRGGDLVGYIETLGTPGTYRTLTHAGKKYKIPDWQGSGGADMYRIDMSELQRIRAEIRLYYPQGHHGWILLDGEEGEKVLKELLHNLSKSVGKKAGHKYYCRGLIVGVVTAMVAMGWSFDDACQLVWQCLPSDLDDKCIPPAWRSEFKS